MMLTDDLAFCSHVVCSILTVFLGIKPILDDFAPHNYQGFPRFNANSGGRKYSFYVALLTSPGDWSFCLFTDMQLKGYSRWTAKKKKKDPKWCSRTRDVVFFYFTPFSSLSKPKLSTMQLDHQQLGEQCGCVIPVTANVASTTLDTCSRTSQHM